MALLILRFTLAPLTILIATLIQRRFGHRSGGRVVGLPLTTGPFLVLVALTQGAMATSTAAHGVVAGQITVVLYCTTYAHICRKVPAWVALPTSLGVAAIGISIVRFAPTTLIALMIVLTTIALALTTWPRAVGDLDQQPTPLAWELPLRMVVAGLLVGTLTAIDRLVSPYLAGLLSTMPVVLSVLGPSTQIRAGVDATSELLRGTVRSMPGTLMFAAVISWTIEAIGPIAFLVGLIALITTDAVIARVSAGREAAVHVTN
jgi:hypothetical protein